MSTPKKALVLQWGRRCLQGVRGECTIEDGRVSFSGNGNVDIFEEVVRGALTDLRFEVVIILPADNTVADMTTKLKYRGGDSVQYLHTGTFIGYPGREPSRCAVILDPAIMFLRAVAGPGGFAMLPAEMQVESKMRVQQVIDAPFPVVVSTAWVGDSLFAAYAISTRATIARYGPTLFYMRPAE